MSKKLLERIYLDRFLWVSGWPCPSSGIIEGEEPDFLVRLGTRLLGVEVTQMFADSAPRGSKMREAESLGLRWLGDLATDYYRSSQAPVQLLVQTAGQPTLGVAERVAEYLVAEVAPLTPWTRREIQLRDAKENLLATVWVTRLPDSEVGYRRGWRLMNDAIGLVRPVTAQDVDAIVKKKAALLGAYRRRVPEVALLIVADSFLASGMVRYEGAHIDRLGFEGVYLLHFPEGKIETLSASGHPPVP